MELSFAAATDLGRQRDHNEDNFLIDKKLQLFIVADGMGGHAAGEVASSITVHQIRDAVHENRDVIERFKAGDPEVHAHEILQILEHSIQAACSMVYNQAKADSEKHGMGTTTSALLIAGAPGQLRGFIAHVGDSRIYLARQNQCHQLTEDHSLMNELIRRGKIKREEFDNSPYKQFKNAVTRAVGVYPTVEVDTFDFDILPGDRFLICSDGLYVYLDEKELPEMLSHGDVKDVPTELIDIANDGGGHDNITTVIIRVGEEASSAAGKRAEELSLKIEVLKSMQLFRYLSYKELVRVMNITENRSYEEDEIIFAEKDPGEAMYVVISGTVGLSKDGVRVAELGQGQHFGEMALIDRTVRSLTATALEDSRIIAIKRRDFYAIIKKEPTLAVKLLWSFVQVLGSRLRKTTADLSGALRGEPQSGGDETPKPFLD